MEQWQQRREEDDDQKRVFLREKIYFLGFSWNMLMMMNIDEQSDEGVLFWVFFNKKSIKKRDTSTVF
jgi:hypothetical protein